MTATQPSPFAAGQTVHIQPMTGRIHATDGCSVARRSRYGTIETVITQELADAIAGGHPLAQPCKKCYGGI